MARRLSSGWFGAALLAAAALGACRKSGAPPQVPKDPSLRLYLMSTLAGALEPCGCRKDMLGGVDHAAALLASQRGEAPVRLLLAAGPLLFQDPQLPAERREQDLWKAEALAFSLADLGLTAWAPGENDFAAGAAELARLRSASGARLLAANLDLPEPLAAAATAVFDAGPYKVGVAGIGRAAGAGNEPAAAASALERAARELKAAGAQIRVALLAAPRGEGLRLAEKVPGFQLVLLGKAVESGEANDAPFPPALVGETLVVQAPNHLQAIAYVDLFIQSGDFSFQDGVGIAARERLDAVRGRMKDLESRRESWIASGSVEPEPGATLARELERARVELAELERRAKAPPRTEGSIFRYAEALVQEQHGSDPAVASRMGAYYRRVNDHNRQALAGREPRPAAPGAARYVGVAACESCHSEATEFWRGTSHARAYATLTRDFKEYNLDCVGCHVTGYERPGGSTVTHVDDLKDVQCESCHGPGSRHVDGDGDTSAITLTPETSVCRGCHETPHVADDWDVRAAWAKILGDGHAARTPTPAAR